MIYDLIEIRRDNDELNKWRINEQKDDNDRVKTKTSPNLMGFYRYPRKLGREKAFEELKSFLLNKMTKEIERLTFLRSKLENLRLK